MMNSNTTDSASTDARFTTEKEYWLHQLAGDLTKSCFHYDQPPGKGVAPGYEPFQFAFNPETTVKLFKLSGDSDVKLHMVLTAVVVALLNRYTGNEDIIIGVPIYKQEMEGEFINTVLAIRSQNISSLSFKELILQVRKTIVEAVEHQNYPLERLLFELNRMGFQGDNDLFDVAVLLENIHRRDYLKSVNPNLVFDFAKQAGGIEGKVEYNPFLFQKTGIAAIVAHLQYLLQEALANIDAPVQNLQIISAAEEKQLLADFNNTRQDYPGPNVIQQLFEEQAAKTPDHPAVVYEGRTITYRELNSKANQLAWLLREKGVKPNQTVAVLMQRSIELAIGIIGILKAGAAYLPVDPGYPPERIKYMLDDSDTQILLTQSSFRAQIQMNQGIIAVDVPEVYQGNTANPDNVNTEHDLVYIIYTSGSTGKPKGVMVEHRNLANFIQWRVREYKYTPADVTLQMLPVSFDGFGTNFYASLLSGGKLVFLREDGWGDFKYISELIGYEKITNTSLVPAMYRSILENCAAESLKTLRFLVLAGEKASADLIRLSQKVNPETMLINEYGPTENTITTTALIDMKPENSGLIGKPIANNQVYIVDKNLRLLPMGVPGELCISGSNLARGYIKNDELTRAKFVPHPFNPGATMYKTGDLARLLPDGNIEFLGRTDHQVKVRGFRIETSEIEEQLLQWDSIREAVVIAKESGDGGHDLWAYFVADADLTLADLKDNLAETLPVYMIPANFVRLAQMPLTLNGKIDRKALLELKGNLSSGVEYIAPRNPAEETLSGIIKEILGVERIGVHESFFDLGGDSIKATTLMFGINKAFHLEVSLSEIFLNQTISAIAKVILDKEEQLRQLESMLSEIEKTDPKSTGNG